MSRYCPIMEQKVTYQFCEDCDEKICKDERKQESNCDNSSNVIFDCGYKNDDNSCKWL